SDAEALRRFALERTTDQRAAKRVAVLRRIITAREQHAFRIDELNPRGAERRVDDVGLIESGRERAGGVLRGPSCRDAGTEVRVVGIELRELEQRRALSEQDVEDARVRLLETCLHRRVRVARGDGGRDRQRRDEHEEDDGRRSEKDPPREPELGLGRVSIFWVWPSSRCVRPSSRCVWPSSRWVWPSSFRVWPSNCGVLIDVSVRGVVLSELVLVLDVLVAAGV